MMYERRVVIYRVYRPLQLGPIAGFTLRKHRPIFHESLRGTAVEEKRAMPLLIYLRLLMYTPPASGAGST